ncbi:hypothetical protein OPKNFCMD_6535 [Methylobacterium crusticola]|uniref:Uncharacterized protein n=1 Tax=Methylobacterium crusticola TaxID=1697972 RepID=A0ABQ4R7R2_9HYPH|nr:hypothetical protein [Methylobacterium crusticola]GJD53757.1 hypothetical protein OPKNFCMD_6535 [Methylobacterium crusticola]
MSGNQVVKLCRDTRAEAPTYRAYLIGAGNHIVAVHVIDARSDEEAAAGARAIAGTARAEVWDRGRRIVQLGPDAPRDAG